MLIGYGISCRYYQIKSFQKMILQLNAKMKIIHLYFMEVWFNMLDTLKFNGILENNVNQYFKNYGLTMILKPHLMDFVLWMVFENIKKEKIMHFYIVINLPFVTNYGAIRELLLWQIQGKIKVDMYVYQSLIYTIKNIFKIEDYLNIRKIGIRFHNNKN